MGPVIFRRIVIGLAFMPLLLSAGAGASAYKEIRDWAVTCNDALTCRIGHSNWDNAGLTTFQLQRSLKPAAGLELVLPYPTGFQDKGDASGRFSVTVDGTPKLELPVSSLKRRDGSETFLYAGGDDLMALVDAMKAGQAAVLSYTGELGSFSLALPLSGVTGSLLYVDEVQGRLDRVDALQAKGDLPMPDKAPLLAIGYDDIPASIRAEFTTEWANCYVDEDRRENFEGVEISGEDGQRLIWMPCNSPGAYNQPYSIYYGFEQDIYRIAFPDMTDEGPSILSSAYNLEFDWRTGTLTSFFRGRGIGDCGSWYRWDVDVTRFDNVLILKELREKGDCDGNYLGGPEQWPAVWPKR